MEMLALVSKDQSGIEEQRKSQTFQAPYSDIPEGDVWSKIVGNWVGSKQPDKQPENVWSWGTAMTNSRGSFFPETPNKIGVSELLLRALVDPKWKENQYLSNREHAARGTVADELTHFHQAQGTELSAKDWNDRFGSWQGAEEKGVQNVSDSPWHALRIAEKIPSLAEGLKSKAEVELQSSNVNNWASQLSKLIKSEANQPKGTRPR